MRNSDGTFAEGNTGRKAGTPNKATTEIKEAFQMLLEDNLPTLQRDISSLEPKERVKFMLELANFIIPKMKSVDLKEEKKETILIDFSEDISFEEN
jgi:inorganic triphosphatase YgiF